MLSNWSGWHTVITILTVAAGIEHVPAVETVLGSTLDGAAIAITTALIGIVGVLAPSATGKAK